ncbi:Uu.00g053400.m01.CDS01 [Anthostomella pinea]|uniref:Postreplication repair E3 ubiquitin-protein ligase RAD18 n=1 Tax=Anthostomella pinea TaxID=933095 RepID=A0AAI8VX16_9PEZI|nr:Uu.00g053400.m01.CDS01 [Anthostomella pinea]
MNNPTPAVEPFDNVADSTDWLPTPLSGLAAVEAALRCQVCKDFYKTPMLTSCNHTFCSICIRRVLSSDSKCPLCRASQQEFKLRSNWSMEEVVAAFTQARPIVLDFATTRPPASTDSETPKRKVDDIEDEQQASSSQPSSKRLRSSTRLSKSRGLEAKAEMARQESHIPDSEPTLYEPDDGLVACPICWQRMRPLLVDKHLDTSCPGEPQPRPPPPQPSRHHSSRATTLTSTGGTRTVSLPQPSTSKPPPERLPALNYSMLKEQQLRNRMRDLGIATTGSRPMLEKRHKEWMTIWNANCDSLRPRRKAELLHDLDVWERTLGTRAPTSSRSLHLGAQIKDKDFDGAAWAAKHDTSFRDLIASARRNRVQAAQQQQSNNPGDEGKEETETDKPGMGVGMVTDKTTELPQSATPGPGFIDLTGGMALTPPHKQSNGENEAVDLGPGTTVIS